MSKNQLFFVSQKAFIQKDGKVLILFDNRNKQDFPGGRLQEKEKDFKKALKREIAEELGIEVRIGKPFLFWHFSPWENMRFRIFCIGFSCEYKNGEIKLSSEHLGYKWVGQDDYEKVLGKGRAVKLLKEYFKTVTD